MKRSRAVHVPLVSTLAAAALAAGCGSSPPPQQGWQACVDRASGTAVEQQYCDQEGTRLGGIGEPPDRVEVGPPEERRIVGHAGGVDAEGPELGQDGPVDRMVARPSAPA